MIPIKVLRPSTLPFILLAIAQSIMVSQSFGQYGASPSQTGMFFDDLRMRQVNERAASQAGTRSGDVSYDYDSGVYRAGENSTMGQRSADYEAAREISRPSVRSGSSAFAARSVGDYTNYSGQYTSPTGFFAPTYTSDPFLSGRRNLKLGPVNVGFGFFQGLEYNDNVNRSGTGGNTTPVKDEISTTMLSIDANYQITQNNRLSLSTAIGFDRYLENPDLAPYGSGGFVLNVLPGSTIAFDIKAGPVFFTIYNRFSVRPAARNNFALSQNQTFGVFQNDSGIAANWRINSDWTLAANYMHSFTNSLSQANTGKMGTTKPSIVSRTPCTHPSALAPPELGRQALKAERQSPPTIKASMQTAFSTTSGPSWSCRSETRPTSAPRLAHRFLRSKHCRHQFQG